MKDMNKLFESVYDSSRDSDLIYDYGSTIAYYASMVDDGTMTREILDDVGQELESYRDTIIDKATELFDAYLYGEASEKDFNAIVKDAKEAIANLQKIYSIKSIKK